MPTGPPLDAQATAEALQLRVDLEGFKPPIWRRLVVPATFTFADLHVTLQIAFGWEDAHLHRFEVGPERVGPTDRSKFPGFEDFLDETTRRLVDALWRIEDGTEAFRYVYDFGDDWRHRIRIEETVQELADGRLPACIGGRRAAPEEDSRGLGEQRMFAGDPEAFDVELVDARLEPLRAWWSSDGHGDRRGRLPLFPSSDALVWVDDDPEVCLGCRGELAAADVPLEVRARNGAEARVRLEAWPCTECGMIHAWRSDLRDRIEHDGIDTVEIERVSLEGQELEVREDGVEVPTGPPGREPPEADRGAALPSDALARLSDAGRTFEDSEAWPAGVVEGLVSVHVEGEGVFYLVRMGIEGSRPGLFVTRDLDQARATHAAVNPDAGGTGPPPKSPSAFDGPVVALGPSSVDLLAPGTADALVEAGLAESLDDELWLPLRVDEPAPALAEDGHEAYRTILLGLEAGLAEAREAGRAIVEMDGVEVEVRVPAVDEADRR